MSEDKKPTIKDYGNNLISKKKSTDKISLYHLMKKYCPFTIKVFIKKTYGPKMTYLFIKNKNCWYTELLNYLQTIDVITQESDDYGTFHTINYNYMKYFITPKSIRYSQENPSDHLYLYKDIAKDFLKEVGIVNKDGMDYYQEKEKDVKINDAQKKRYKIIGIALMIASIIQIILLFGKYGYQDILLLLGTTLMLITGLCILFINN